MNNSVRFVLVALLCIEVTACVYGIIPLPNPTWPMIFGYYVFEKPEAEREEKAERERQQIRCTELKRRDVTVTEAAEVTVPAAEGDVRIFTPAYWQVQFQSEGYPKVQRVVEVAAGTLAITDTAALWVSAAAKPGVHIPLEAVNYVHLLSSSDIGGPPLIKVESCFGRFDIFSFAQERQPIPAAADSAAATAAALLRDRVAASRGVAHKEAEASR
jgi:hypothetical protein